MGPGFESLKVHPESKRLPLLQLQAAGSCRCSKKLVRLTQRVHLFPFRTQKLSSVVPKILGWRRPGKIGIRQHGTTEVRRKRLTSVCFRKHSRMHLHFAVPYSSIAQSVEHLTVNQGVTGSSPVGGVLDLCVLHGSFFFILKVFVQKEV